MEKIDWSKTKKRLDDAITAYKSLQGMPGVNVSFALAFIYGRKSRYEDGERSRRLHKSIMEIKL